MKVFCSFVNCDVRLRNGERGRRVDGPKVYMTDATYKIMKEYLGEEFEHNKSDVVCSPCFLRVRISITIWDIFSTENIYYEVIVRSGSQFTEDLCQAW